MKKVVFLIIFLLGFLSLQAQDTLRYWTLNDEARFFDPNIMKSTWQFQRFEINKPIYIKSFIIYLFGEQSKITIKLIGNQGGSALPSLFAYTNQDVLATSVFQFSSSQKPVGITFDLSEPLYYYGHQLFIAVSIENSSKCFWATNITQYNPTCQPSELDAPFYYQFFLNTDSTQYKWSYGNYSFFADLVYNQIPDNPSGKYLRDYTGTYGVSFNIPGKTVAFADFNKDGFQDLLVSGRLYLSTDGTNYKEQTTALGLQGSPSANSFVDINNDGNLDILFLFSSPDASLSNVLYINDGTGKLTKSELAITKFTNVSGYSLTDANYDGFPDLFVSQLITQGSQPQALPNYFYKNNGNNTFLYQSSVCKTSTTRASTSCQFVDYNNDGSQDLYVSNGYFHQDELWENRGILNYVDVTNSKKIDQTQVGTKTVSNWGYSNSWYDYDNNTYPDLFVPNLCYANWLKDGYHSSTIYKNINGSFTDTYNNTTGLPGLGIDFEETYSGGAWGDFDNDGLVDLFIPASSACRYSKLYHQKDGHTFENVSYEFGVNKITSENDALWVDVDNDGMLDLVLSMDNNFKIYRNFLKNSNSWIELDLEGTECNKFAIGAKARVYTKEGKLYSQEVLAGGGRNMQKPYRLHFGLGNSQGIERVEILWYHATSWEVFENIELNKITNLKQIGTSVEDNHQFKEFLEVYPNPIVSDNFSIEFSLEQSAIAQVQLYDMQGIMLKEFANQYFQSGANYIECKIDNIPSGAYFITLVNKNQRIFKPIIISK